VKSLYEQLGKERAKLLKRRFFVACRMVFSKLVPYKKGNLRVAEIPRFIASVKMPGLK
jgi:hypothetical protein